MTPTKKQDERLSYERLGHMLVNIYETGYLDIHKSYKHSFIKGVIGGFGGVIGATIVVGLMLWLLSLFDQVPLVGNFIDAIRSTLQTK